MLIFLNQDRAYTGKIVQDQKNISSKEMIQNSTQEGYKETQSNFSIKRINQYPRDFPDYSKLKNNTKQPCQIKWTGCENDSDCCGVLKCGSSSGNYGNFCATNC